MLSGRAAYAQSAVDWFNSGLKKESGDLQGAIADWSKAIEMYPQYAYAYYNRGLARRESGDLKKAIADYTKAIKINPKDEIAYSNRGLTKKSQGDMKGACSDWKKAAGLGTNTNAAQWFSQEC